MRLLFVTQALDLDDPVLSVYHSWVEELAHHIVHIEVVCLMSGRYAVPDNVRVHSLGKAAIDTAHRRLVKRVIYTLRFLSLSWKLRNNYDAVFVHMNQEYLLIAGWLWKLLGKKAYLWRNHYAGSFLTDCAALFCEKVFCTSRHSYTAKYAKTRRMPVGVNTKRFFANTVTTRRSRSILFFGRMAESKRPGLIIDALILLGSRGVDYSASFVGSPPPGGERHFASLKQRIANAGLLERVTFLPGISNTNAPDLYRSHEIFVNTSPSGMLDKTIFEAAASGCVVLAASDDWKDFAGEEYWFNGTSTMLADKIETLLEGRSGDTASVVAEHSLSMLGRKLAQELSY